MSRLEHEMFIADVELGVDAAVAIGAAGGDVDLPDQAAQPAAAQLSESAWVSFRSSSKDGTR